jgi:hypothetical protein
MKTSFFKKRTLAVLMPGILMLATYASFGQINATQPYRVFAAGATNAGTLACVIIGAHAVNGGTPVITSLFAGTDKSTAKVQFYKVLRQTSARYANNSGAVISVDSTNGFVSGDVIIIRHLNNDGYEKRTLTTMTSATNLTTTAAPYTTVPGDIIYGVTTTGAGSIPVSTNNVASPAYIVSVSGTAIYAGQKACPLLVEIDATTTGTINYATAVYSDP